MNQARTCDVFYVTRIIALGMRIIWEVKYRQKIVFYFAANDFFYNFAAK